MPTVAEPVDEERRAGKASSVLDYYARGMLGEAATVASLRILRYEPEDIRHMMEEIDRCRARRTVTKR